MLVLFYPSSSLGRVPHFLNRGDPSDNLYMRLDFPSKFDGPGKIHAWTEALTLESGIAMHGRSPLDLVIVLDIRQLACFVVFCVMWRERFMAQRFNGLCIP